ncbi:hypothetical protein BKA69DRAFT_1038963 [Paraphysoderma sedebokerense]|nr:hypothetical protein BKA69DRAFT_1040126 [Paraphysoderma sedebokerense]KAI9140780.1 hypothetical protein BKA69DRAFT_1038963 [Paraphysoderma sedebokerense]
MSGICQLEALFSQLDSAGDVEKEPNNSKDVALAEGTERDAIYSLLRLAENEETSVDERVSLLENHRGWKGLLKISDNDCRISIDQINILENLQGWENPTAQPNPFMDDEIQFSSELHTDESVEEESNKCHEVLISQETTATRLTNPEFLIPASNASVYQNLTSDCIPVDTKRLYESQHEMDIQSDDSSEDFQIASPRTVEETEEMNHDKDDHRYEEMDIDLDYSSRRYNPHDFLESQQLLSDSENDPSSIPREAMSGNAFSNSKNNRIHSPVSSPKVTVNQSKQQSPFWLGSLITVAKHVVSDLIPRRNRVPDTSGADANESGLSVNPPDAAKVDSEQASSSISESLQGHSQQQYPFTQLPLGSGQGPAVTETPNQYALDSEIFSLTASKSSQSDVGSPKQAHAITRKSVAFASVPKFHDPEPPISQSSSGSIFPDDRSEVAPATMSSDTHTRLAESQIESSDVNKSTTISATMDANDASRSGLDMNGRPADNERGLNSFEASHTSSHDCSADVVGLREYNSQVNHQDMDFATQPDSQFFNVIPSNNDSFADGNSHRDTHADAALSILPQSSMHQINDERPATVAVSLTDNRASICPASSAEQIVENDNGYSWDELHTQAADVYGATESERDSQESIEANNRSMIDDVPETPAALQSELEAPVEKAPASNDASLDSQASTVEDLSVSHTVERAVELSVRLVGSSQPPLAGPQYQTAQHDTEVGLQANAPKYAFSQIPKLTQMTEVSAMEIVEEEKASEIFPRVLDQSFSIVKNSEDRMMNIESLINPVTESQLHSQMANSQLPEFPMENIQERTTYPSDHSHNLNLNSDIAVTASHESPTIHLHIAVSPTSQSEGQQNEESKSCPARQLHDTNGDEALENSSAEEEDIDDRVDSNPADNRDGEKNNIYSNGLEPHSLDDDETDVGEEEPVPTVTNRDENADTCGQADLSDSDESCDMPVAFGIDLPEDIFSQMFGVVKEPALKESHDVDNRRPMTQNTAGQNILSDAEETKLDEGNGPNISNTFETNSSPHSAAETDISKSNSPASLISPKDLRMLANTAVSLEETSLTSMIDHTPDVQSSQNDVVSNSIYYDQVSEIPVSATATHLADDTIFSPILDARKTFSNPVDEIVPCSVPNDPKLPTASHLTYSHGYEDDYVDPAFEDIDEDVASSQPHSGPSALADNVDVHSTNGQNGPDGSSAFNTGVSMASQGPSQEYVELNPVTLIVKKKTIRVPRYQIVGYSPYWEKADLLKSDIYDLKNKQILKEGYSEVFGNLSHIPAPSCNIIDETIDESSVSRVVESVTVEERSVVPTSQPPVEVLVPVKPCSDVKHPEGKRKRKRTISSSPESSQHSYDTPRNHGPRQTNSSVPTSAFKQMSSTRRRTYGTVSKTSVTDKSRISDLFLSQFSTTESSQNSDGDDTYVPTQVDDHEEHSESDVDSGKESRRKSNQNGRQLSVGARRFKANMSKKPRLEECNSSSRDEYSTGSTSDHSSATPVATTGKNSRSSSAQVELRRLTSSKNSSSPLIRKSSVISKPTKKKKWRIDEYEFPDSDDDFVQDFPPIKVGSGSGLPIKSSHLRNSKNRKA